MAGKAGPTGPCFLRVARMPPLENRVAIYHFSGQILGRTAKLNPDGSGRPGSKAAAAAAYRSGSQVRDYRTGELHDYSRRKGVAHAEIMVPVGAAAWLEDRELLWGTVERMEKRADAQLAREFNMALPHELDAAQRLELDPKTVVKLAGALGIVTPWKPRAGYTAHVIDAAARTAKSVKEATRFTQPKKAGVRARIDWREVDQRVCRQVRQVAQQLRGKAPPVRVSLPQIERRLRNRGWLTKRAAKLPESMACVRGMVESVEQFQRRRVSWMIVEMDRADEPLQVWRVLRKSGLTGKHADLVRALLDWHFNSARRQAA